MTDFDRFTEFLLREAAGYNEPPETPAGAMWPGVEVRVGLGADRSRRAGNPAAIGWRCSAVRRDYDTWG